MIADWSVEATAESPEIAVPWEGWVDLRPGASTPEKTPEKHTSGITEAQSFPELLELLRRANTATVLTSKVDVFPVTLDDADPELAENLPANSTGLCSYLDLLPARPESFATFTDFEQVARATARRLQAMPDQPACAEIVIRPARLYDIHTFGWTLYALGFGQRPDTARQAWEIAARITLDAMQQSILEHLAH